MSKRGIRREAMSNERQCRWKLRNNGFFSVFDADCMKAISETLPDSEICPWCDRKIVTTHSRPRRNLKREIEALRRLLKEANEKVLTLEAKEAQR